MYKKNIAIKVMLLFLLVVLNGCGGTDKNEKPKNDEPTTDAGTKEDDKKDDAFEKMTKAEMAVLKAGDIVTKLPDSEYLNSMDLDFLFVYNQWIKKGDSEYPKEPRLYYTTSYQKDGEVVIKKGNEVESSENYKLKEIIIGEMEYTKIEGSDEWYKFIYKPDGIAVPVIITSAEKIEQLNKGEVYYIE